MMFYNAASISLSGSILNDVLMMDLIDYFSVLV